MNYKNYILLSILCNITLQAEISQIRSFQEAEAILATTDKNTLVLFDVDETLIYWADKIQYPKFKSQWQDMKKMAWERAGDRQTLLRSKIFLKCKKVLIEPFVADIIRQLQDREVKVLALTKMESGNYGIIPLMEEWRYQELRDLGITFKSWSDHRMEFSQCVTRENNYPVFYKGILVTNRHEKGEVLGAFLDTIFEREGYKPDRVMLFEDQIGNLQSVEQELASRGIAFEGYHYLGPYPDAEFDPIIAQYQLDYLHDHEEWLTDEEAAQHLASGIKSCN